MATLAIPLPVDAEQKTAFAAALLRSPDDPFKAATQVFGDFQNQIQAATKWILDPFVKGEQLRLLTEKGEKAFLPSKEDQLKDIYMLATKSIDEEIRLKAHRLYAEIAGNIEKPGTANVTVAVQNVMVVKDHGSDDEWEQKAIKQQKILIGGDLHAS